MQWRNWAGNQRCAPTRRVRPQDEAALAEVVAETDARGGTLRPVGAGHSFTPVATTDDVLVDLTHLRGLHHLDDASGEATFGAGTTLAEVNRLLAARGRALENLGDIDVQTLAGATQTGTHGTGARFGNLASTIVGARLVSGTGELVDLRADDDRLRAVRVGLGACGVLTAITVRTVPAFTLTADERIEPVDDVVADLDRLFDEHDHAELFWFPGSRTTSAPDVALVKRNQRDLEPPTPRGRLERFVSDEIVANAAFGAAVRASERAPAATRLLHAAVRRLPPSRYTEPSPRVFTSPRRVRFVEMELSVPRPQAGEAFGRARDTILADGRAVPVPVECRVVAGDDADLSPAHGDARVYLAFHLSPGAHDPAWFAAIADALEGLDVRPHWGKLHPYTADELAPRYPRWDAFQQVRAELDPHGTLTTPELARVLGPASRRPQEPTGA